VLFNMYLIVSIIFTYSSGFHRSNLLKCAFDLHHFFTYYDYEFLINHRLSMLNINCDSFLCFLSDLKNFNLIFQDTEILTP
jgi:hypothetical protein